MRGRGLEVCGSFGLNYLFLCVFFCVKLFGCVQEQGITALPYHAGMENEEREHVQRDWLVDRVRVVGQCFFTNRSLVVFSHRDKTGQICATIAFGMGIDKRNVRFVFHYSLPKTMEGYFQEAGRAGRDQREAHCLLFYNYSDKSRLARMILGSDNCTQEQKRQHLESLNRVVQYCENIQDCRVCCRVLLLSCQCFDFSPS
jgi:bloom syndrome protein